MQIVAIPVSKLRLNPHNDRHGALRDEASSIHWLLENKGPHMRSLATDLASALRLYENPLVQLDGDFYTVFDGNRRTCCIKLILDPNIAPSEKWRDFFIEIGQDEVRKAFLEIDCEVESDMSIIDEKLFRRHTGSQDGVGQSQWDAEGKSHFLQRTGKDSVGLGETIEKALKAENLIPTDMQVPWSNLERLFSSEPIRKRAGISFSGGTLIYLGNRNDNLDTLTRVVTDLSSREKTLDDIWNNQKKNRYLDELKSDGLSIDNSPAAKRSDQTKPVPAEQPSGPTRRGRARKDRHLISGMDSNPFLHLPNMERAEKIWRELQLTLEFEDHDNAIAVLMRVLLEIAINYYAREQGISFSQNDAFARRVASVSDSMLNRALIDTKARSIIRKFEGDKPIVSAHSMHQYIHNANFHPTRSDLKAIWNVVRPLIMHSVK